MLLLLLVGGTALAGPGWIQAASDSSPPAPSPHAGFTSALLTDQVVTLTAQGKPPSVSWSAYLGTLHTTTKDQSIVFSVASGDYTLTTRSTSASYRTDPASELVSVRASNVTITVVFSMIYFVTFNETGLPSLASWNAYMTAPGAGGKAVNLGGAAGTNLTFREPNATYQFGIQAGGVAYQPNPQLGTITVAGAAVTQKIVFTPPLPRFNLTFTETGLPQGIQWFVDVNGRPTAPATAPGPVTFAEPNGQYNFTVGTTNNFEPHPFAGIFVVDNAPVTMAIVFTPPPSYRVTFAESGLPGGTWAVSFNGTDNRSAVAGTNITFDEKNGSFAYTIPTIGPYVPSPQAGTVRVLGAAVVIPVSFSSNVFPVLFVEFGLIAGSWWVTMNGTNESTPAGSGLSFVLPNGTYSFAVGSSALGYLPTPAGGTVRVSGTPSTVSITFGTGATGGSVTSPPAKSKLLSLLPYGVLAIAAVLGVFVLVRWLSHRYEERGDSAPPEGSLGRTAR